MAEKCKGFICGGNLVDGSVPSDKLDKETIIELIKEILKEEMHESWLKEIIETTLKESIDSDWLREFFKEVLKKYAKEEWFKDIICGLGCVGVQEIFDVIPTDITFEATGGTATVQVVVDDGVEWELTL